jgi:hypothetical protein
MVKTAFFGFLGVWDPPQKGPKWTPPQGGVPPPVKQVQKSRKVPMLLPPLFDPLLGPFAGLFGGPKNEYFRKAQIWKNS